MCIHRQNLSLSCVKGPAVTLKAEQVCPGAAYVHWDPVQFQGFPFEPQRTWSCHCACIEAEPHLLFNNTFAGQASLCSLFCSGLLQLN